jgi:glycosyltransferase involved in cell wall biosynthesis
MAVSPKSERLNPPSAHAPAPEPPVREPEARQLTVLYLDHCAQLSGGEIALARLLASLPETGVRCEVVLGEHGPLEDLLAGTAAEVTVLPLPDSTRQLRRATVTPGLPLLKGASESARYVVRLAAEIRRRRPDLVVTNSLKAALYGGVASRLAGVPVVWHQRDRVAPDYLPRFAVALVRLAARLLPRGVIANSRSTLATLHLPARAKGRPVTAVIGDPFERQGSSRVGQDGPLVVGMVGRLAPWKGQEIFLRAFADAFPDGSEHALIVGGALFGEDTYAASLPALVSPLGLDGRVDFSGHVADVAPYYAKMDVLVHASTVAEPFGQVIVEGMAEGIPVVASAAGGPTEIVTDGVDGILYPPSDVGALTEALRHLAADPPWRERIGHAGQETARRFAPTVVALETEAFYRRVLETRPARRAGRLRRSPSRV